MAESVDNAKSISGRVGSNELTMVGYSKGGAQAAADAMATGRDAITFNAAGVSNSTRDNLQLGYYVAPRKIDNYNVQGQFLSAESIIGLSPAGTTHNITAPTSFNFTQSLYTPLPSLIWNSFINHLMPAVNKGMGN